MVYFPSLFWSWKASLNLTCKCVIVVQLEPHLGNWLMTWVDIDLGVFNADGDQGPGDHPQVHPGPPRPPAQVGVRGQDTAPHPMILRPSLQHGSNARGRLEIMTDTLNFRSQLCLETKEIYLLELELFEPLLLLQRLL